MTTLRAFLAIPLPAEIIAKANRLQKELDRQLPDIRWVKPAGMHLTLKFFAAIPEETLEKIGQIMLSVGRLFPPFPVSIAGLGTFPEASRARVFWLGIRGNSILHQLQQALEEDLAQTGIARDDRPFTPHLTLGRRRQGIHVPQTVTEQYQKIDCGSFLADRVVLFQSRLDPAGATHIPLRTVALDGLPPGSATP